MWKNRQLFILMIVFAVSAVVAVTQSSAPMQVAAAAAGGALIGLIAPSPSSPGQPAGGRRSTLSDRN